MNHIKYDNEDSDDDDNKDLVNIIDIMADIDEYEDDSALQWWWWWYLDVVDSTSIEHDEVKTLIETMQLLVVSELQTNQGTDNESYWAVLDS